MLTAWLVLSGRWDVFGRSDDMPPAIYFLSGGLAGLELACEFFWILKLTGAV
jgi:hypothetical protein